MLHNNICVVSMGEMMSIEMLVRPQLRFQDRIHRVVTCWSFWFDFVSSRLHLFISSAESLNLRLHQCFVLIGFHREIFQSILCFLMVGQR